MVYPQAHSYSPTSLEWAAEILKLKGYHVRGNPEPIRTMPWSKVTCFFTSEGLVYLKEMAPLYSLEPRLIQTLYQWDTQHLPKIIAENSLFQCFLMSDAGVPLRDYQPGIFQLDYMITALDIYAKIQISNTKNIGTLYAIGVPDWRVSIFPELYNGLLQQEEVLRTDGLTPLEIKLLKSTQNTVSELCQLLSDYNIPETIETMDFQDNNILVKNNHITIADWGDAVISHPFFSLAACLYSAKRNHGIQEGDDYYHCLQDAYLNHWSLYETKDRLIHAFRLAKRLRLIQVALSFGRTYKDICSIAPHPFKGYLANALRDFTESQE